MNPLTGILIVLGLALMAYVVMRQPGIGRIAIDLLKREDVDDTIAKLEALPEHVRPTAYNNVIKRAWQHYRRELACKVIRMMGERHADADITQYWIKQALDTEPETAAEVFDEEFITRVYRPDIARRCGSFG